MKYRNVHAQNKHTCDTCHQEILPGTWFWQEFDEIGFWLGVQCEQCHNPHVPASTARTDAQERERLQKAQTKCPACCNPLPADFHASTCPACGNPLETDMERIIK